MSEEKRERKTKVFCNVNVYLDGGDGRPVKVKAGMSVLMDAKEIKHFGKAVTKDIPDDAVEFERA